MGIDWERLSSWFEHEATRPVTQYKQPLRKLAQRAAASVLLDEDPERFAPDLAMLADKAQDLPALGDLAAARLAIANVVDDTAQTCVARYAADPQAGQGDGVRADHDEVALGAALLTGNLDVARAARAHRAERQFDDSVALSAELVFLADEILRGGKGDPVVFAAVRGIDRCILAALNRTVAPFVCAFGATARSELRAQLRGALRRYDELSFAGEKKPYLLKPQRLELTKEPRITLVAAATGDGCRLDVINTPALLDDLPSTFFVLRKALTDKDRRAFDKLRKDPATEFEIAIAGAPKAKASDVFARRVSAALALMSNYASKRVSVTLLTGTAG